MKSSTLADQLDNEQEYMQMSLFSKVVGSVAQSSKVNMVPYEATTN